MIKPLFKISIFILTGWLLCFTAWSQAALPDSILHTLNTRHPRLLVRSLQEFEAIKKKSETDEFLNRSVANVLKNADSLFAEPVVTYSFMDAFRLDTKKVNAHCFNLSMAYRLTGNKKYADRLWKDLEAVSRFPDWNPRHFLDCSLITQPVAVAYDWLYDVWTPEQRRILKQQIISKGLLESLVYYDGLVNAKQFDWSVIEHNWNLVCNGNMAIGALAIADEEGPLAERVLREALTRFPKALRHFGPDGAWNEGPGYWSFAMRAAVPILSSLTTSLGTDFGLTDMAGFSKAGQFFVALGGADAVSFNYADALPVLTRSPELFWLANRFHQPKLTEVYKSYGQDQLNKGGWPQSPLELLWYGQENNITKNDLPLDNYFRDAEVATLRSGWDNGDWFVGFKAGDNEVNHGHLDIGSYVLDHDGIRWIMDLGFENYNVPGYFGDVGKGSKRWTYYRTRAEGHNTFVVNPNSGEDQDVYAKTRFNRFETTAAKSFGIMDITDAYKAAVTSAKRGIAMVARNSVLIQDEIKAANNIDLYWFSHTKAAVTLSKNGKTATLQQDGKRVIAQIHSPATAVFELMEAKPLPTSPHPEANNKNEGVKKLFIHLQDVKDVLIAVEFTSTGSKKNTAVVPLSKW